MHAPFPTRDHSMYVTRLNNDVPTVYDAFEPDVSPSMWLWAGAWHFVLLIYGALWVWMIIECIRKDPERGMWLFIIAFVPFGALFYFAFVWIPASGLQMPSAIRRFARQREIERL